jgi:hypothetical protein
MAEPAPIASTDWPITVIALCHDPGYSVREVRWWSYALAGVLWLIGATLVLETRTDPRGFLLVVLIVGWIGWQWFRRRPADLELILGPDRLRIRDTLAGTPATQLEREDAGALLAAESGVDWRERFLMLTDENGQEVLRLRAGRAAVVFPDARDAPESWWRSVMPPGTSPERPPSHLSATALIGTWWPRPDQRWSVRGSAGVPRPWGEGDLATYEAWDRRQRRRNGLLVIGIVLVGIVLATVFGSGSWTVADLIVVGPPLLAFLVLLVREVLR